MEIYGFIHFYCLLRLLILLPLSHRLLQLFIIGLFSRLVGLPGHNRARQAALQNIRQQTVFGGYLKVLLCYLFDWSIYDYGFFVTEFRNLPEGLLVVPERQYLLSVLFILLARAVVLHLRQLGELLLVLLGK